MKFPARSRVEILPTFTKVVGVDGVAPPSADEDTDAGAADAASERARLIAHLRGTTHMLGGRARDTLNAANAVAHDAPSPDAAGTVARLEHLVSCLRHTQLTVEALSAEIKSE
jgi:hypothetical protein